MSLGYSVAQTARLVSGLRWVCGRLSEMLQAWAQRAAASCGGSGVDGGHERPGQAAASPGTEAEAAVRLAELGRRLAWHRETLDGLQPDSVRLAAWHQASPAGDALVAALDEVEATEGSVERLDVALTVFVPQLTDVYGQIGQHAAPHCDAALAAVASRLLHDLQKSVDPGAAGQAIEEAREELSAVGARSEAAESAERVLAAAGGLVAAAMVRPETWP